jgi:hypothetical protein
VTTAKDARRPEGADGVACIVGFPAGDDVAEGGEHSQIDLAESASRATSVPPPINSTIQPAPLVNESTNETVWRAARHPNLLDSS